MENNNLSLYLEEAEKERYFKDFNSYIKKERIRLKKVKKIKKVINILSAVLLALIIYLIKVI